MRQAGSSQGDATVRLLMHSAMASPPLGSSRAGAATEDAHAARKQRPGRDRAADTFAQWLSRLVGEQVCCRFLEYDIAGGSSGGTERLVTDVY